MLYKINLPSTTGTRFKVLTVGRGFGGCWIAGERKKSETHLFGGWFYTNIVFLFSIFKLFYLKCSVQTIVNSSEDFSQKSSELSFLAV